MYWCLKRLCGLFLGFGLEEYPFFPAGKLVFGAVLLDLKEELKFLSNAEYSCSGSKDDSLVFFCRQFRIWGFLHGRFYHF
jgi:hypothetical protein